jgi:hypothetical protein
MIEVYNYYGTTPTLEVLVENGASLGLYQELTGNENDIRVNDIPTNNTKEKDHSPLTTNTDKYADYDD